jgi:hypothetical protein
MTDNHRPDSGDPINKPASEIKFARRHGVRVNPKIAEIAKPHPELDPVVTEAVRRQLQQAAPGYGIECLIYPNHTQLETILCPRPPADAWGEEVTRPKNQKALPVEPAGPDDSPRADEQASLELGRTVGSMVDETVKIQRCNLVLDTLGLIPVATRRFALPDGANSAPRDNAGTPVNDLLPKLYGQSLPFIYQFIVQKERGEYFASLRLCIVDNDYAVESHQGVNQLYNSGHPYAVEAPFRRANFDVNTDIPVMDYYRLISEDMGAYTKGRVRSSNARAALTAYAGQDEYEGILNGTINYNNIYSKHDIYPRFPFQLNWLPYCLTHPRGQYENDPWATVAGRGPPALYVTADSPETDAWATKTASETTVPRQQRAGTSATAGSDAHDINLVISIERLQQQGYIIVKVEQEGGSVPDAIGISTDGEPIWVEYDFNHGDPENYIKNVSRAVLSGVKPILVVGDKPNVENGASQAGEVPNDAETMAENLFKPYKKTTARGTLLFLRSHDINLPDGSTVLLPSANHNTKWYVTIENAEWTLVCYGGDKRLASGPADESVTTFDYDAPRYRVTDDGYHVVERPDGTELARDTTEAVLDDYTKASLPHLPVRLSYGGIADLLVNVWGDIQLADVKQDWAKIPSKEERYEQSVDKYLDTFLVDETGNNLLSKLVHKYYWFVLQPMTDKKLPKHPKFGTARDETKYPSKRLGAGGSKGKGLTDVQWALPPDIVSPDVPTLDIDDLADEIDELAAQTDYEVEELRTYFSDPATGPKYIRPHPDINLETADSESEEETDSDSEEETGSDSEEETSPGSTETADSQAIEKENNEFTGGDRTTADGGERAKTDADEKDKTADTGNGPADDRTAVDDEDTDTDTRNPDQTSMEDFVDHSAETTDAPEGSSDERGDDC